MKLVSSSILSSIVLLASVAPAFAAAAPHIRRGPTSQRAFKSRAVSKPVTRSSSVSGISGERATQIQSALIKQGYLTGTPTGTWDKESQAAMEKMQSDNGWQTKLVPDSRAIIKLGLGPNSTASAEPESMEAHPTALTENTFAANQ
ncbi:peptidoglycan-binding domain-containing protein [Granulicella tundricola]|uniref:Peptidoglycan-binding domain 1 protein n=1 Tax=Granulicella tundricola (strain ATCC BAA-1859 / DSM 23138 / MP5ACTX9) TaxID=1198114 RepID=E8WWX4_GRATM|nr:peptidoglycan-binding domain-containing protein [Granulicella tundricola]ADW68535.1 Peptidoglycan-binding domain 1 protein [Granulicella tundricola MP5ACTX9]